MDIKNIDAHIESIVLCLQELQLPDGSWGENIFTTGLITSSLKSTLIRLSDSRIPHIIQKAQSFLIKEKRPGQEWNYYKNSSGLSTKHPNDWDDTASALLALGSNLNLDLDLDNNDERISDLLNAPQKTFDSSAGTYGAYKTWFTSNTKWTDIDFTVNAHIGKLLSTYQITPLAAYINYIDKQIDQLPLFPDSLYYHIPHLAVYFLSAWYNGIHHNKLIKYTKTLLDKPATHRTESLILTIALFNMGVHDSSYTPVYPPMSISMPMPMSVPMFSFTESSSQLYIESISPKSGITYGSNRALDLAFHIEYFSHIRAREIESLRVENKHLIQKHIASCIDKLPTHIRQQAKEKADAMLSSDKQMRKICIPLELYYELNTSLIASADTAPLITLSNLCACSLFGWLAYDIYDKIIDNELPPAHIPIANIFHRETLACIEKSLAQKYHDDKSRSQYVMTKSRVYNLFMHTDSVHQTPSTDATDNTSHSIPSLYYTYSKSIASLIPIILLFEIMLDSSLASPNRHAIQKQLPQLYRFFTECILIRQLADDIKDIDEDSIAGRTTRPTFRLRTLLDEKFGKTQTREQARKRAIHMTAKDMHRAYTRAQRAIRTITIFRDKTFLYACIRPYVEPALHILKISETYDKK